MKFFLIGIKGSGMAALALYLKKSGYEVCGCDVNNYVYTQDELLNNDIKIYSFDEINLNYVDIIIVGHAFMNKNLEIIEIAKRELIPIYEYHQFLNLIQEKYKESVAICGSHGKTTTTSLFQYCLNTGNAVSSLVGDGSSNVENKKNYFVFEACEYQDHFLVYYPKDIVILNIDYDHNDYFVKKEDYYNSFVKFSNNALNNIFVQEDYLSYFNNENIYSFGFNINSTFNAQNTILEKSGYCFDFYAFNTYKIHVKTKFYAKFMIEKCLALLGYAYVHNFDLYNVVKRIPNFGGVKKRNQETIINDDIYLIDYAHHPSQIKAMIEMARNKYCDREIVAIYKPDRYSRVMQFYKEIAHELLSADISFVEDFPSNTIKDIEDDIDIYSIIEASGKKIKHFKDISQNDFFKNKKYLFLLMSSKDVNPILEKIKKTRL